MMTGLVRRIMLASWLILLSGVGWAAAWGSRLPIPSQLAYSEFRQANQRVRLMDFERRLAVALTGWEVLELNRSLTFSPDGQRLAFMARSPEGESEIALLNLSDGTQERVNAPLLRTSAALRWSPDGAWLAARAQINGSPKLVLTDLASETLFVANPTGASDSPPLWSPDSRSVYYLSFRDGSPRLYRLDAACRQLPRGCRSNERLLLPTVVVYDLPVWSPDGNRLAFIRFTNRQTDIVVLKAACFDEPICFSEMTALTTTPEFETLPVWSPDGEQIAFVSDREHIAVLDLASGQQRRIITTGMTVRSLSWSPDNRWLIYSGETPRGPGIELLAVLLSSGIPERLSDRLLNDPVWRPE